MLRKLFLILAIGTGLAALATEAMAARWVAPGAGWRPYAHSGYGGWGYGGGWRRGWWGFNQQYNPVTIGEGA